MRWLIIALCSLCALAIFSLAANALEVTGNVISGEFVSEHEDVAGSFVLEERVEVSRVSTFGSVQFNQAR